MKNILTIAKWEILRLRTQFGGKSKFILLPVIVLTIFSAFLIYHQDFTVCKGLYTIGVSPDGPAITDIRFKVLIIDEATGNRLLRQGAIDLYLSRHNVNVRRDERSRYAAGALQKYLEKQELSRLASQYDVDKAFPLRVEITYLKAPDNPETASKNELPSGQIAGLEPSPAAGKQIAPLPDSFTRGTDTLPQVEEPAQTANPLPDNGKLSVRNSAPLPGSALPAPHPSISKDGGDNNAASSDSAVRQQLTNLESGGKIPEFKAQFATDNEIIVPSLMNPPMPLAQVIIAFLYIVPIFFVSVFFTSSFTEEKVNRRLIILLSAPVSRSQVMIGKMLPYFTYSILVIMAVTTILHGNLFLAMSIFVPVMLFIFSIYLMVALTYRTFKDQTFFSVLALSVITVYLVVPAMFTGVSNLSFVSPLTLAVTMYRGETFGLSEYLLASLPLYLTFFLVMLVGARVFTEEYLMGFKPLHVKAMEALYLAIDKKHLNLSIFILGLLLIPLVMAVQLVAVVMVANLPSTAVLWLVLVVSVVIEEVAKSVGMLALIKNRAVSRIRDILILSSFSALGFWIGEKALLFLTMKIMAESKVMTAVLGTGLANGWQLVIPLFLHIGCTCLVGLITAKRGVRSYTLAVLSGAVVHALYNMAVLLAAGVFR